MSYILDALKKSEQERGHGNAPGVQTVHSASINYHNEKKSYWPYILIIAVLLNLIALIYFIIDKEKPMSESTVVVSAVASESNHEERFEPSQDRTIIETRENNNLEPPVEIVTDSPPTTSTTAVTPEPNRSNDSRSTTSDARVTEKTTEPKRIRANVIDYHDLNDSIKLQLPTITVSAHVYSSNPAQRSIVINNEFLEEGEYIMDNLVLYEITPDGAILNYQGTLFNYGVVSSWQ